MRWQAKQFGVGGVVGCACVVFTVLYCTVLYCTCLCSGRVLRGIWVVVVEVVKHCPRFWLRRRLRAVPVVTLKTCLVWRHMG
ncbi:hypothetical protein BDU57DRAFT_518405 [Ampelomyces quisqualis]|uniref:Uncharacterized protein n=1 Tax=Ampelomyces quisqualis TaxID=50730 RepID=A0A6A5QKP2_AMPQU|nr:hypothetical protein BDU57DRAFT_518405 [Ampelomyces quisqualis]